MFPFPGLPYGVAPWWCFPLNEVCLYALMVVCFVHAIRKGKGAVAYLLGGLVFGLILEYLEVLSGSYTYGRFFIMIGRAPIEIPFCIGCGWAIILYSARLFSDAYTLPLLGAVALDTLLALNIDLSMDVVAYRLHMWHWYWSLPRQSPLTSQWFGIPYGNFVGWITVVFCYSFFSRLLEKKWSRSDAGWMRVISIAAATVVCSQAVLFGTETFLFPFMLKYLHITSGTRLLALTATLLLLTAFGWSKRRRSYNQPPVVARWVPCYFHFFFAFCFFALGFYRENRWMTTAALINAALGIVVHLYPFEPAARLKRIIRQDLEQQAV